MSLINYAKIGKPKFVYNNTFNYDVVEHPSTEISIYVPQKGKALRTQYILKIFEETRRKKSKGPGKEFELATKERYPESVCSIENGKVINTSSLSDIEECLENLRPFIEIKNHSLRFKGEDNSFFALKKFVEKTKTYLNKQKKKRKEEIINASRERRLIGFDETPTLGRLIDLEDEMYPNYDKYIIKNMIRRLELIGRF